MMNDRIVRRFAGIVAVVALALALSGCGSSKKGNGYYAPLANQHVALSSQLLTD